MMVSFLPRAVDMIDDDRYREVVFGGQSGRRKEAESIRWGVRQGTEAGREAR